MTVEEFIRKWRGSGASERANFQPYLLDLATLLGVPAPKPSTADGQNDDYRFERPVTFIHTAAQSRGLVDLYRRGCFVMEAKQGTSVISDDLQLSLLPEISAPRKGHGLRGSRRWDDTMMRARNQADSYARAVARSDGWPPFLLIVDVGHVIEVYADFSGQGQGYTQFPDGNRYRITLDDLRDEKIRDRLRTIWNDPQALDPAKTSAEVTRQVAAHLAELGKSFEAQGHRSEDVARFLMRALFTMFAEDVHLIPEKSFSTLLKDRRGNPEHAAPMLEELWSKMNTGGFSTALARDLKRFNGGLFRDASALPLSNVQLSLLIQAASHNWREVEPAIFGTLLERALDKRHRHKLGAHYTPRAYVERLVNHTVIEPLRAKWRDVQAAAAMLAGQDRLGEARQTVRDFHHQLCSITVLDPACGSGNFLYVALELMKRLEGEVIALLRDLGEEQVALALAGYTVDPHQFLGIEVNPWAAAVAELVLWIGYLQWHFRTHGTASPAEPVLRDFHNIQQRDAVLTWEGATPRQCAAGQLVTRWDGVTTITNPVTGEQVPDAAARVVVMDYKNPRPSKWPQADFIVGNPPFIGASRMRDALGDGYTEALRAAYPWMPESADFVMFWWDKAALAVRGGKTRRLGLITTNSLRQTFNRQVLEPHLNDPKKPLSLAFAIPDHPWVDAGDGAAVRIAMTVAEAGSAPGRLFTVASETKGDERSEGRDVILSGQVGKIFSNLRIGADVAGALELKANRMIGGRGAQLMGQGFLITKAEALSLKSGDPTADRKHLKPYLNGRDLTSNSRQLWAIDFFNLSEQEARGRYPAAFQVVLDRVKPERQQNNREGYRRRWWQFGENVVAVRDAIDGLNRYIATVYTAKHRIFSFVSSPTLVDATINVIGTDDAALLSVLSSRFHVVWALAAGGRLGYGNDPRYNKSRCFDPFPFPDLTEAQKTRLRALGEELDAHRKAQQAAHPRLSLTGMYNALEKLRAGERIEGRDKEIYDAGLVGILRDIHDRIDAAVADAYGWPVDLSDDDILHCLVDLNRARVADEASGHIRWLRPEYQNPSGQTASARGQQAEMDVGTASAPADKAPWPKTLPEQIAAVRTVLQGFGEASPHDVAKAFARGRPMTVEPLLKSLSALGYAREIEPGRYAV